MSSPSDWAFAARAASDVKLMSTGKLVRSAVTFVLSMVIFLRKDQLVLNHPCACASWIPEGISGFSQITGKPDKTQLTMMIIIPPLRKDFINGLSLCINSAIFSWVRYASSNLHKSRHQSNLEYKLELAGFIGDLKSSSNYSSFQEVFSLPSQMNHLVISNGVCALNKKALLPI